MQLYNYSHTTIMTFVFKKILWYRELYIHNAQYLSYRKTFVVNNILNNYYIHIVMLL